ncbi:MAG: hypothetical protein WCG23_08540 [bacterium]
METCEIIVGIIRAQISNINEKLIQSKIEFADCNLSDNEWHNKNERKIDCKMYQAQIEILENMEGIITEILTQEPSAVAA